MEIEAELSDPLTELLLPPHAASPHTSGDPAESDDEGVCSPRSAPLVVTLALSLFLVFSLVSLVAPFLPEQLDHLGAGHTLNGLLFALYPLVSAATSFML
eukprot:991217_1